MGLPKINEMGSPTARLAYLISSSSSGQLRKKRWSTVVGCPEYREVTDLKNGTYFRGALKCVIWCQKTSGRVTWNED